MMRSGAASVIRDLMGGPADLRPPHCVVITSKCVSLGQEIITLFLLAIPVAAAAWTVTHEAIFRELQQFCRSQQSSRSLLRRKFFYVFTCEYCFSHYVSAVLLVITRFKLLFPDWRGYFISWLSLVWIANQYTSIYDRLRLDIKREHIAINADEEQIPSAKKPPQEM